MIKFFEPVGEASDLFDDQVDGFGAAVGDAMGIEVGQYLLAPGLEGATQSGDFGDRAGREAGDHFLRDPAALSGGGVVDGAELLIALPGKIDFPIGIAGLQTVCELGLLAL